MVRITEDPAAIFDRVLLISLTVLQRLSEAHNVDQQEPAHAIVAAYCDKVVDRRDQGS